MVSFVEVGEILSDRYRILKEIGKGTYGTTYLAEERQGGGEPIAIQEFRLTLENELMGEQAVKRFQQEAEILCRLEHPQIPKFHDLLYRAEAEQARIFLVREYVPGQTLRALLQARWLKGRTFSELDGLRCLQQMLPLLDYIHSMGVIHRDICPDNLILRQGDNKLILMDFGGIKHILTTLQQEFKPPADKSVAQTLGRPGYAPPEQLRKGIIYTYSDLYALAMTVLVLLTGKEPNELLNTETKQFLWEKQVEISDPLADILKKMLAQQPSDRFHSAYDVQKVLKNVPKPSPAAAKADSPAEPSPDSGFSFPRPPRVKPLLVKTGRGIKRATILLLQVTGVLGFTVGAGFLGWYGGQKLLQNQSPPPPPEEEGLELSPTVPEAEEEKAETLSFPPMNDPEPDPSEDLPPEERERKLKLRDRRLELAISYEFFRSLLNQQFWAKYPDREGQTPSDAPEDKAWRDLVDETAAELLEKLTFLGGESRRGLGRYRSVERDRILQEIDKLNVSEEALDDLTNALFFHHFPKQKDQEFQYKPIGQVWQAIAFEQLEALKSGKNLEKLVLSPNEPNNLTGKLEPGHGQIYLAQLEENQKVTVTLTTSDSNLQFFLYNPSGESLLEQESDRSWSGQLPQTGHYQIVIVSNADQPLDYQLSVTAE